MDGDIPPRPELRTVADGGDADGYSWRIQVGGPADDLTTVLDVRLPDGRLEGGGLAGPALAGDRQINYAWRVSDAGYTQVVGRTAPTVAQVDLRFVGRPDPVEVTTVAGPDGWAVRFFAAVLPGRVELESVVAVDLDGRAVPQRPDAWLEFGLHRPRPPRPGRTGDHGGGWEPA
jgi:hypothetical protein